VAHSREPVPLFEKLEVAGWGYSCQENADGAASTVRYFIYIYRLAEQERLLDYLLATEQAQA